MPFTGGPAVRVSPNSKVEIHWVADFVGTGRVDVFDNANGGTPIESGASPASTEHKVVFTVGGLIKADTTYFFKVSHLDPTGTRGDLTNDPAPYPPFFTGAQALSNVKTSPAIDTADVSWDANVIGTGAVMYGIGSTNQGPVTDNQNIPNHAFTLTGLTAGSTYQYKISNNHEIGKDALASATGQFQTPPRPAPSPTSFTLTQPHAEPRTIDPTEVSTLSIRAQDDAGVVTPNAVVQFSIDPTSQGSGSLGGAQSAQATTNANGIASVQFTGANRGNVHVNVTSATTANSHKITVVVKRV